MSSANMVVGDIISEETVELQKISGISKINNFLFTEDSLQAWRTYAIGPGKTIASEKVPGRWLTVSFTAGGFKPITLKSPSTQARPQAAPEVPKVQQSGPERHLSSVYSGPKEERHTPMDLAKHQYATYLQEGVRLIPALRAVPSSVGSSHQAEDVKEGWVLKQVRKPYRFNQKRKTYLEEKFNIGQSTRSKIDPAFVAKEMCCSRCKDGERLFVVSEFLTLQQVSSFFSRLALKVCQQQLHHPIVVDPYNVCSLVNKSEFRKTKVALLQHLCERLEVNTPVPAVRRKVPFVELLGELVNSCP
ncbi:unnamed protein product [Porites lobata]|uniref:Uncharacterized protein n=1 Tax=Porites lobata TaxID=104759 RepID=A0ABN8R7I8_9CNID|nr:unnamed protein product [Porites lobata]